MEKWIPINVWQNSLDVIIIKNLSAEESWLGDTHSGPIANLSPFSACFHQGSESFVFLTGKVAFSQFGVLLSDVIHVFGTVFRAQQMVYNNDGS